MAPTQKYTDAQMLYALRAAAEGLDEPLTAVGYDDLRPAGGPSSQAIIRRFGRWRDALQRAGLASNIASGHQAHWTEDQMIDWVATYLAEPESTGSYNGYAIWAKTRDGAPSGPTIRIRFDKWAAVKAAARARNDAR